MEIPGANLMKCFASLLLPLRLVPGVLLPSVLIFWPFTAIADIYRCESKGDTYFSQIPCNDSAEEVVIEDRHMFSSMTVPAEAVPAAGQAQVRSSADNLKEFVETLHRQRNQEMAAVDRDITTIKAQLAASEGRPADDPERLALSEKLASLNSSRVSIADQYDSMITEAESRVAALSAGGEGAAKSGAADG